MLSLEPMPESSFLERRPAPFLKWAGGKSRLIPQLAAFFPQKLPRGYLEPFAGGGAVFFHVRANLGAAHYTLIDNNEELIHCYRTVRDETDALIERLGAHRALHSRAHYYQVRQQDPGLLDPVGRAARFIYLNKTCYNGLYRVNSRGRFNVPIGAYPNPQIFDPENLRSVAGHLQGVALETGDFEQVVSLAQEGDFVYFDPPYHPISRTSKFTSYTPDAFSSYDQERLKRAVELLAARGCLVMVSNSDCEFIRDLYRDFRIETVQAARAINSDASRRGLINEVVVLNY